MCNLDSIVSLLSIFIGSSSLVFSAYVLSRQNKSRLVSKLAHQVAAYYAEEEEAVKLIAELEKKADMPTRAESKIKIDLRDKAVDNPNSNMERPKMTAKEVRDYYL